ncbi:hypothetical protein F751_0185 [Auxenochlorella protothecoides]|uniref:Uncharacterized protein n=1 Tax=Auxenochlorella protothecoides TaxID=3075 RepID=A0A087S9T3_AUXPR|nr:hypothetical protein F751_0185 [Auxenochlorella protothecoides]KFM22487.1 hypothetical protein F751_0185 [Auxenochlorella protothecoides]
MSRSCTSARPTRQRAQRCSCRGLRGSSQTCGVAWPGTGTGSRSGSCGTRPTSAGSGPSPGWRSSSARPPA